MASRGEVAGPRVEECRRALSWYRLRDTITAEAHAGRLAAADADHLISTVTAVLR